LYDPYTTYMDVVPMDAPLPPAPPVLPPVTYTPPPAPVPEPATWAMLIAGFALAGAVFRRRAAPAMPQR
jgi:hypothetical protein